MDMILSTAIAGFIFLVLFHEADSFQSAGSSSQVTARANEASTGWNDAGVNLHLILWVTYRGLRISVYNKTTNADSTASPEYFFQPALIINLASATSYVSSRKKRAEFSFEVLMWDAALEELVWDAVRRRLKQAVPRASVGVLPIEELRIGTLDLSPNYEVINQWMPYSPQPPTFTFRFSCTSSETCDQIVQEIKETPQLFLYDLKVSYSLNIARSARRTVKVQAEHIQEGRLYSQLRQQIPNMDVVYLTANDVNQMILEIATNVMATEVMDDTFTEQESLPIAQILQDMLQMTQQSSESFQERTWNSVFWRDENNRPDRVTSKLNELYTKADDQKKVKIRNELSKSQNSSSSVGGNVSGGYGPFNVQAAMQTASADSNAYDSANDNEQFVAIVREAAGKSVWAGERFVVKPMKLMRINIARLQNSATVTTAQVRLSRSTAHLTSRISVLAEPLNDTAASNIPTGSVQMFYGVDIPVGWLLCDGSPVDCSVYPQLCHVLRDVNETDIRAPDLRGRTVIGAGCVRLPQTTDNFKDYVFSIGETGGEVTHRLTEGELPSHFHDYRKLYHSTLQTETLPVPVPAAGAPKKNVPIVKPGFADQNQKTARTGSSSQHNNMQPYLAMNFIIKT